MQHYWHSSTILLKPQFCFYNFNHTSKIKKNLMELLHSARQSGLEFGYKTSLLCTHIQNNRENLTNKHLIILFISPYRYFMASSEIVNCSIKFDKLIFNIYKHISVFRSFLNRHLLCYFCFFLFFYRVDASLMLIHAIESKQS